MGDARNDRLRPDDQIFVYAMQVICCSVVLQADRLALALAEVRDVLPKVNRSLWGMDAIAQQAERMLNIRAITDLSERRSEFSSAKYRGGMALNEFFLWRLALVRDAQAKKGDAA